MKIRAAVTATIVITSVASMAAAQTAALPPAASPAPAPESQPLTPAAPPPEFGDPGEYVISSAFFASFGHLGYTNGASSTTNLSIQPSLDYFVIKNVSIGGALYFSHSDSTGGAYDTATTALGAYAHLGGNVTVGPLVSWRPILSIGYRRENTQITASSTYNFVGRTGSETVLVGVPERNEKLVVAQIFAPFLIHPARHFFLGIGPDFFVELMHLYGSSSDNRRIFIGASSVVGGWFGGAKD